MIAAITILFVAILIVWCVIGVIVGWSAKRFKDEDEDILK